MDEMRVVFEDGVRDVIHSGDRGKGGAFSVYHVRQATRDSRIDLGNPIAFQSAPITEVGVKGWTNEALIAVVIDRLESFQAGDFPCEENAQAIRELRKASGCLLRRTLSRIKRGVEGKHEA